MFYSHQEIYVIYLLNTWNAQGHCHQSRLATGTNAKYGYYSSSNVNGSGVTHQASRLTNKVHHDTVTDWNGRVISSIAVSWRPNIGALLLRYIPSIYGICICRELSYDYGSSCICISALVLYYPCTTYIKYVRKCVSVCAHFNNFMPSSTLYAKEMMQDHNIGKFLPNSDSQRWMRLTKNRYTP